MSRIIDFHTHAFPDQVAVQAIPALEKEGKVKAYHDGRLVSLLATMDAAGIERSVICSIATRPTQFDAILNWSRLIASPRIIPFPSVHPDDPQLLERISQIRAAGFVGLKMHPYYQGFTLDEAKMWPLYQRIAAENLVLVMHTGFDIAFPREAIASPARIVRVVERVPSLKLIATHLGAWEQWEEVERELVGRPLYMDISYTLHQLAPAQARRIILGHPADYLLFGTDSPWADQRTVLAELAALKLPAELERKILWDNGIKLLAGAASAEDAV
ncbi:MAG TPA: amidohydrolase [Desulfurivibrio alkaliphilus]|uniref:Amidohydrolase n=1 Tax=Desulfurivibrio alkaliphilus TaxID=427923 RepID=A0A7C2TGH2_9BACT|nr:amidohydrolase [Desulfurivibrio alkaliphilus]